jgi:protein TonB
VTSAYTHTGTRSVYRSGVGALLSIAAHGVIIGLFLMARGPEISAPVPLSVRVLSAAPESQQPVPIPEYKPVLTRATFTVPLPDIAVASTAPAAAIMVAASSTAAPDPTPPAPTPPRFDADYLNNPPPHYPPLSRRLREEGTVLVRVYVLPNGMPQVVELKHSSGCSRLDDSALQAVRKWRFLPARRGHEAVAAWVVVPIAFSLAA